MDKVKYGCVSVTSFPPKGWGEISVSMPSGLTKEYSMKCFRMICAATTDDFIVCGKTDCWMCLGQETLPGHGANLPESWINYWKEKKLQEKKKKFFSLKTRAYLTL